MMNIEMVEKADHLSLLDIWEASVRATHDFLAEEDLQQLKPLILEQYFDAVHLKCAKNDNEEILGFCGVHDGNIEMLFISPDARGKGIGSMLATHAIKELGATKVDVNEQNQQALGFYQHIGFSVTGRSPVDGQGKPYPLLHMKLYSIEELSMYPDSIDENRIGEYPAETKSGGGYFYDQVLEYRVWCRPWQGAPDEFDGEIYYYAFHTYNEALKFSNETDGSESPLVLIKQLEWIDEPEAGKFIHKTGERLTEWRVEWLFESQRKEDTIAIFISDNQT